MASFQLLKSHLKAPFVLLLIVETCVVFGSIYSASLIRYYAGGLDVADAADGLLDSALVISALTMVGMMSTGLYVGNIREGMPGVLLRVAIGLALSSVGVALVFYLVPELSLWRGILALAYTQSFFVIGTVRAVFFELVDASTFKSRLLVYGAGSDASFIDKKLRRKSDRRGFEIVGYIRIDNQESKVDAKKILAVDVPLLEFANANKIDEIVVAARDLKSEQVINELVNCKLNGIGVLDILSFFEREAGQIRIDILEPAWLVTSDGFRQSTFQNLLKRMFDLVVSLGLFTLTIPIQIVVVAAIWAEDGFGAPIIYRQRRMGSDGKIFNLYKFRSMVLDAEKAGEAVWAIEGDSRITRIGATLRKYRLDELPQALNVLWGDMSFVGPRPERPEFVEQLGERIPYYKERHVLKPGLTGWAQLNYPYGSSLEDAYQKHIFDMYYVKNHSLFLDCLIILQTVEIIIFGKGAR